MNDYLLNLAARSFDRTGDLALVRPRIPSRFEQPQPSRNAEGAVESGEQTDGESAGRVIARRPMHEGGQPTERRQTHTAGDAPNEASGKNEETISFDHQPAEAEPGRGMHEESAEERSVAITAREDLRNEPAVRPASIPLPEAAAERVRPIAREDHGTRRIHVKVDYRLHETPASVPGPVAAQEVGEARRGGPLILPQEERSIDGSSKPPDNDRAAAEPVDGVEAAAIPRLADPEPRNERFERKPFKPAFQLWEEAGLQEQKPKQDPVINVTIGRIEVRAVTQAARSRPKPKAPQPMSLDAYLRGRNGGGR